MLRTTFLVLLIMSHLCARAGDELLSIAAAVTLPLSTALGSIAGVGWSLACKHELDAFVHLQDGPEQKEALLVAYDAVTAFVNTDLSAKKWEDIVNGGSPYAIPDQDSTSMSLFEEAGDRTLSDLVDTAHEEAQRCCSHIKSGVRFSSIFLAINGVALGCAYLLG